MRLQDRSALKTSFTSKSGTRVDVRTYVNTGGQRVEVTKNNRTIHMSVDTIRQIQEGLDEGKAIADEMRRQDSSIRGASGRTYQIVTG